MTGPLPLPILMYHAIDLRPKSGFGRFMVTPGRLEEHLDALTESGFRGVAVSDLLDALESGNSEGLVGLTFDDAFADVSHALALLESRGFGATVYVPTGYVGATAEWLQKEGQSGRPLLSWAALGDVVAHGFEVGGHSHTHAHLDELTSENAFRELAVCRSLLSDRLGVEPRSICYPFGHATRTTLRLARSAGWANGCGVGRRLSTSATDPMALDRLEVTEAVSGERLVAAVCGDASSVGAKLPRSVRAIASWGRRTQARLKWSSNGYSPLAAGARHE
jgi:peptidoglycan/xylan/chitin deacetylase (PgdA/CDA1 family)